MSNVDTTANVYSFRRKRKSLLQLSTHFCRLVAIFVYRLRVHNIRSDSPRSLQTLMVSCLPKNLLRWQERRTNNVGEKNTQIPHNSEQWQISNCGYFLVKPKMAAACRLQPNWQIILFMRTWKSEQNKSTWCATRSKSQHDVRANSGCDSLSGECRSKPGNVDISRCRKPPTE